MIFVNDISVELGVVNPMTGKVMESRIQNSDIAIKFYHVTQGNERNRGRSTRCEILSVPAGTRLTRENGVIIGEGETKVFSGNFYMKPDRFDRRVGRREALTRALEDAGASLGFEDRKGIWEAYRACCKLPNQGKLVVPHTFR